VINNGKIEKIGAWKDLNNSILGSADITHYPSGLIIPGFIDTHIHYPQLDMIAANGGGDLLHWYK
jgi:guanine deaminase